MYLIPSVQDTKGKEWRTLSNGTTIKTVQAESQKDSFFPKNGQMVIQNENKFTRTYMRRISKTEIVNHSRRTVLERSVKN